VLGDTPLLCSLARPCQTGRSPDCPEHDEIQAASPDLNNLIVSSFGWVYKQTGQSAYRDHGEAIFAGGVTKAWLAGSKQFNESYTSSYHYLRYRQ
jgi:hypothetical protein